MKLADYIGEATAYDKKLMLERKDPISWLKSVSAFANTQGGKLLYGVSDSGELIGLENAEKDAEDISEAIKTQMDPIPQTNLSIYEEDGKRFVVVEIFAGEETPYYVRHKGSLTAYVRIGNESVKADPLELNRLVLKGSRRSWDSLPSVYKRKDFSFEVLYSLYHEKTLHSFEETDFQSFGLIADDGCLTNAGALFADRSPIRHSRVFCTRWNGLDKAHGVQDAHDDAEYEGGILTLLDRTKEFVRRNSKMPWRKMPDGSGRVEYPEYPLDAVEEALVNALIHRDYLVIGSEVHVDIFDDRLEICSPGGMPSGEFVQSLDMRSVPSERRNPVVADLFQRLRLMERRGSGFKKIIGAYQAESQKRNISRSPEFRSTAKNFFVIMPNLNYGTKLNEIGRIDAETRPDGLLCVAENPVAEYSTQQATQQATQQVTQQVRRLLGVLRDEMDRTELMAALGLRDRVGFKYTYLDPALEAGLIEMTQPDSPRSPTQKYRLTEKGVTLAKQQEA